ncbi:MAG: DUF2125 domain-containing protein [Proteobacteria bacterium]|nr:DUF2125 domain-containing protein [Pseudomonadota bacterium]
MRAFLKSLIFNIAFFTYCIVASLFFAWAFLLPRKQAWAAIRYYFLGVAWVERLFLGLDYRVTGLENLPPSGTPYILAVKHYSAYETLKVPVIFRDIAIILKRELTYIPFWGWYTIKCGMIPVDRGAGGKAVASLIAGAKRAAAEGRPILIFPQGTRVSASDTTKEKPYKVGIAKIAQALDLPIVPVAINSAAFWPKHSFLKRGGIVDFKILPPLPRNLSPTDTLKMLEGVLEPASAALMAKPKLSRKYVKRFVPRWVRGLFKLAVTIFVVWAMWWYGLAYALQWGFEKVMTPRNGEVLPITSPNKPEITGFPLQMRITWADVTVNGKTGNITTPLLQVLVWPLPSTHASVSMPQSATLQSAGNVAVTIDRAEAGFVLPKLWTPPETWGITLTDISTAYKATMVDGAGAIAFPFETSQVLNGEIQMRVSGYKELISELAARNVLDTDKARLASGFFEAMETAQGNTGAIAFPFKIVNNVAYAGFVRLFDITYAQPQAPQFVMPPQKNRSGDLGTDAPPAPAPQMLPQPVQP